MPFRLFLKAAVIVLAAAALSGCADEPNFETPSTFDMVFRFDEVQGHLQQRRQLLSQLKSEAARADRAARQTQARLASAKQESARLAQSNAADAAAVAEYEALDAELRATYANLNTTRDEIDRLRREEPRRQAQVASDQARIKALNDQVEVLNLQIVELQKAIDATVEARRRTLARQSS